MPDRFALIAKTFFGLENVLADELIALGAQNVSTGTRMVSFSADQRLLYRANLWCRTAVRILKPIHWFTCTDLNDDPVKALYQGVQQVDWSRHLDPQNSLVIDPVAHGSLYKNSLYAAQVAKDAIVDQFRQRTGSRPTVDLKNPDLRINLHISQQFVTVYLDASGDSLHKRGYRTAVTEAPLNEVLAAGILRLSEWDQASPLADFMCGSGTLPIEAALMARNIAPGTLGRQFGFTKWKDFDRRLFDDVLAEARAARREVLNFPIAGSDRDSAAIAAARENARRAGVAADIHFAVAEFDAVAPPAAAGTLVANPPYDERMKVDQVGDFYRRIGDVLKQRWSGYTAQIFTGNLAAAKQIGLRTSAKIRLFNGPIECRLLKFKMYAGSAPTG